MDASEGGERAVAGDLVSDDYPDLWKPVAERRPEPARREVWASTGSGHRFPLVTEPGRGYPASWGFAPEREVIAGVLEFDQDGD